MPNKIKLKYESGNVLHPKIHEIGLIALGSHLENHGSALPIDTDSKIASNITLKVATDTGATYLGVFYAATEYDYVKHGIHLNKEELVNKQIIPQLLNAKTLLNLKSVIIVNGHGGNNIILDDIHKIEEETDLKIIFNNSIIEHEGPHACTGELSMGEVLGIIDKEKLGEHDDFNKNPEVGMVGLTLARKKNQIIDKEAKNVEEKGFYVDKKYGEELLNNAYNNIMKDIKELL